MATGIVNQTAIGREGITEVAVGLRGGVYQLLHHLFSAVVVDCPLDDTSCAAVYVGDEEDLVFFSLTKVNSSSISMVSTSSGKGAGGSWAA